PAGIDGLERRLPRSIGDLISAQEFLSARVEESGIANVGVHALGVTMPYVDDGTGKRRTRILCGLRNVECQLERCAELDRSIVWIRTDVGAIQFFVDEIRSFGFGWPHNTPGC